jgi:hypothetical protein
MSTNKNIFEEIKSGGIPNHTNNGEIHFHFFERDRDMEPTVAMDGTVDNLKEAIQAGVACCLVNETDIDMFVNLEWKTYLPGITLKLGQIPGITAVKESFDRNLRYEVAFAYELNVIFSGGGSPWIHQKPAPTASGSGGASTGRRIIKAVKPNAKSAPKPAPAPANPYKTGSRSTRSTA